MTAIISISVVMLFIVLLLAFSVKIEWEYDAEFFVKVKYLCFTLFMTPKSKRMLRKERKKAEKEKKKQEKLLKKRENLRKKREKGQHLKEKKPQYEKSGNKDVISENRSDKEQNLRIQKSADKSRKSSDSEKRETQRSDKKDKPKPSPETIIGCIKAAKPYVKRLFKKIRFYDVFAEIVVGGDDAAKTAVSYGVHCAAVHGLVCFLKNTVSFKEKKIDIKANFELEKTDYYVYGKIKLRLSTLLRCAIWGFFAVKKAMSENPTQKADDKNPKSTPKKAA